MKKAKKKQVMRQIPDLRDKVHETSHKEGQPPAQDSPVSDRMVTF